MTMPRGEAPPLVAVAHGSRDPRAAAAVEALLETVRRRGPGRGWTVPPVVTAYLDHAAPAPGQVLGRLAGQGHSLAVVLPLLLTAAYHSKTDLPGVLRDARRDHPRLDIRYGATLGPHPLLRSALRRRLATVTAGPSPDTAVVLAAAGSSDPGAVRAIERLAGSLRQDTGGGDGWHSVVPAYASAARPTPAEAVAALRAAGVPRVVVAPYLLAPGYFADRVRAETRAAGALAVAPVLGAAPELADIVLQRYHAALHNTVAAAS